MPDERGLRQVGMPQNPYLMDDDWTPGRGWAIAMRKAGVRSLISFIAVIGFFFFVWPYAQAMPQHGALLTVTFGVSGGVGLPMGYLVTRKLAEDSGLAGRSLMLPVLGMLVAVIVVAYLIVYAARGSAGMMGFSLGFGVGIWCLIMGFRGLVTN